MQSIYNLPYDRISRARQHYTNERPRLRTVPFHGIELSIEIEPGEIKSGIGEDGQPWSHEYEIPYGEIPSTKALSDGDGVDIYLGPDKLAKMVYVIHQMRHDGSYDEDKCMLQFSSPDDAESSYRSHGPSWGFGSMDQMTVDQFLRGYLASNRKL